MFLRKFILATVLLFGLVLTASASNKTAQLLNQLDEEISNREDYLISKQQKINQLTQQLYFSEKSRNNELAFNSCSDLLKEYQSFSYDSAFKYVFKLYHLADQTNDIDKIAQSKIRMGFTFLSSGLFKEALDTLNSIDPKPLSVANKKEFYNVIARTYYDLADYNNDEYFANRYRITGNQYLDSAIALIPENSSEYWATIGLRRMKAADYEGAADAFNFLISQFEITDHTYAIATSSLGYLYSLMGRKNEAIDMLINAAIGDIKSSIKETVALRNLAVHLFEEGDVKRAYGYIKIALDDATDYNARHRKVEVGSVLPIIEGERLSVVDKQRKKLLNYVLVVSMLSVLVLSFFSIIFIQYRKLNKVKMMIQNTNVNLREINHSLREANKIKQEYIGYFFNVNSNYIDKLESLQKKLHRKVITKQFNDLEGIITSTDLKKERQELYSNFDKIFLKIFPKFIEQFNALFNEEDRIYPEKDELLNTDLRIFALIRLGITDNEKIAKFLNYSVNTIYTYKTKIKNKTIVNKDEFDNHILEIRSF